MAASVKSIISAVGAISLVCFSHPCLANESLAQTEGILNSKLSAANVPLTANIDLGWDSKYVSQGRNNLAKGGIYWMNTSIQYGNLTTYALVGRGDSQAYTEWNIGLEYALDLSEHLEANLGYQRIEGYSSSRCQDNELFAELAYTAKPNKENVQNLVADMLTANGFIEIWCNSLTRLANSKNEAGSPIVIILLVGFNIPKASFRCNSLLKAQ